MSCMPMAATPPGVAEVNRDKKVVWNYVSHCPQVLGCEREPNGNTLLGEQGPCRAVEVDPAGKIVASIPLVCHSEPFHTQVRNVHLLPNGDILSAHEADSAVREVNPLGKLVWEYDHVENTGEALRLPNGNTLIAGATSKRLFEVTPKGETVWEFSRQRRSRAEHDLDRELADPQERPHRRRQLHPRRRRPRGPRLRSHSRQESRLEIRRSQAVQDNHNGCAYWMTSRLEA